MKNHPIPQKILFLLDYDGTITDFDNNPEDSHITPAIRRLLRNLRIRHRVILVSGRHLEGLTRVSGLKEFPMVGTHGFESRRLPGGLRMTSPTNQRRFRKEAARLYKALQPLKRRYSGIFIESKPFSSTLHYRGAKLSARQEQELFREFVSIYKKIVTVKNWTLQGGKKMIEVMPKGFSKAKAVKKILDHSPGYLPVYAGDDIADSVVFKVLGKKGLKVAVGKQIPDKLCDLRFANPKEFLGWLGIF
jgi:trehalose-phosphatase